jgi:hypothetical protein
LIFKRMYNKKRKNQLYYQRMGCWFAKWARTLSSWKHFSRLVIVYDYPIKSFYMFEWRSSENSKVAMDILFPGIGEMVVHMRRTIWCFDWKNEGNRNWWRRIVVSLTLKIWFSSSSPWFWTLDLKDSAFVRQEWVILEM